MLLITEPTNGNIDELSETMQYMDKESIKMLTGWTPYEGLSHSVANSIETQCYILNGKVAAISGINKVTFLSNWACPWLICSDIAHKSPRQFMMLTKQWVEEKLKENKLLSNVVYDKHEKSKRWLKWLGFSLSEPFPIGPYGALFRRNEMIWANK